MDIEIAVKQFCDVRDSYEKLCEIIFNKINTEIKKGKIELSSSTYRTKSLDSFRLKCQKKIWDNDRQIYIDKYTDPLNQMTDLSGVRIVTYLVTDKDIIKEMIPKLFDVDEKNSDDKLNLLSDNKVGYLSVHYIVSLKKDDPLYTDEFENKYCEIQIRTVLQDAWAQIFHDRQYKNFSGKELPLSLRRETSLVAGTLELIDNQINALVKSYDALMPGISKLQWQKILNSAVDAESLKQYIMYKFHFKASRFYDFGSCFSLLSKYNIHDILSLDEIVNSDFVSKISIHSEEFLIDSIIGMILIIWDVDKFNNFNDNFEVLSSKTIEILKDFVDIDRINISKRQ